MYDPSVGKWLSEDPIGFDGGDLNFSRYVGNNATNATDPTGLLAEANTLAVPTIEIGKSAQGVDQGVLKWKIIKPQAPKGLELYTNVDISWGVRKTSEASYRSGNYRFWLEGITAPNELQFNLSPYHGSQNGLNKAMVKPWDTFKDAAALDAYLAKSFDLRNTIGRLTVRLDFRGYKKKATEKFNPALTRERTGPFEVPTTLPSASDPKVVDYWIPNRVQSRFRTSAWLDKKPAIWDSKPEWQYSVVLTMNWDWSRLMFAALYRIDYPSGWMGGNVPVKQE